MLDNAPRPSTPGGGAPGAPGAVNLECVRVIPKYADWRRDTNAGAFARRSTELVALDTAIREFEKRRSAEDRAVVKEAFLAWKAVHGGGGNSVAGHRRDAHGLLRALELEFTERLSPTPSFLSRVRTTWPDDGQPPGAPNLSEHLMRDRLDKAFVDTQVVLRSVVRSLQQGGPGIAALVREWFGEEVPAAAVLEKFKSLQTGFDKFRGAGEDRLKVRLGSDDDGFIAAASSHEGFLAFSPKFFNDRWVFPATSLSARPAATTENLQTLRALGGPYRVLAHQAMVHGVAQSILKGKDADVDLATAVGAAFGRRPGGYAAYWERDFRNPVDLTRGLAGVGLDAGMLRDQVLARATAERTRIQREMNALVRQDQSLAGFRASASGVVIHELSHLLLSTHDLPSPALPGVKCYGATRCMDLASRAGDAALRNADSYRLFAEAIQF
jgi:hypothetical protein